MTADRLDAIDEARADVHHAGRRERGAEEQSSQTPEPATWDDAELHELGTPQQIANMRARIDANRGRWLGRVVSMWETRLVELETRWGAHVASAEHARWLAEGGPARLWERCNASKHEAERQALLVAEAKGDAVAFEAIAELEQWRMNEMVRLYLNQAAAE
jgi:hypothetical protein